MSIRSNLNARSALYANYRKPNDTAFPARVVTTWQFKKKHGTHARPWDTDWRMRKPFGISFFEYTPRVLLDRDMYRAERWDEAQRVPDASRWEKFSNGKRVTEDRWALVAEDGEMHKVSWKLYSDRIETELDAAYQSVPQFRHYVTGIPMHDKYLDTGSALARNLSLREASAQCKLHPTKKSYIVGRLLEMAKQGAEAKGLDKEKLRVASLEIYKGKADRALDLRSKGYYAWKSLRSSRSFLVLAEDPEMILPDRSTLPYASQLALRKAGIATAPTEIIDVPVITAEGI